MPMLSELCKGMEVTAKMTNRSYHELSKLKTFEERYAYLRLNGKVGEETFGFDRYLNQSLYKDPEWLEARDIVILRDNGCDLGMPDREIQGRILVHHLNPITKDQILRRDPIIFDPENLICTAKNTHDAIHYGDESILIKTPIDRKPNDTCPWKKV